MKERKTFARQKMCNSVFFFFECFESSEKVVAFTHNFISKSSPCRRLSFATSNQRTSWPGTCCVFLKIASVFFPMFCCPLALNWKCLSLRSPVVWMLTV